MITTTANTYVFKTFFRDDQRIFGCIKAIWANCLESGVTELLDLAFNTIDFHTKLPHEILNPLPPFSFSFSSFLLISFLAQFKNCSTLFTPRTSRMKVKSLQRVKIRSIVLNLGRKSH